MSPMSATIITGPWGFPRVSGDEPTFADRVRGLHVFSPRERG